MSEDETSKRLRNEEVTTSEEEVEEDEEDDDEEEEDDDEILEVSPAQTWGRNLYPPSEEEKEKIRNLQDILGKKVSPQRCLKELRRFLLDEERAIVAILDCGTVTEEWKEPVTEREKRELQEKIEELEKSGAESLDAMCNTVRQRLLWGDNRVAWLDGAATVFLCLKRVSECQGELHFLPKPQQVFLMDCLNRATSIMLDQEISPQADNFTFAASLIDSAIEIASLTLINKADNHFVEVFASVLSPDKNLWKNANEEYHTRYSRISLNEKLIESLFQLLNGPWLGSETVSHILMISRLLSRKVSHLVREKLSLLTGADQSLKNDKWIENVFREMVLAAGSEDDGNNSEQSEGKPELKVKSIRTLHRENFLHFWFKDLALRLFNTSILEQRLFGLSQIERLLDTCSPPNNLSPVSEYLLGKKNNPLSRISSGGMIGPHRPSSFSTTSLDKENFTDLPETKLAEWLQESDFFHLLVDKNRIHSEILLRSKRIVKFMVSKSKQIVDSFPAAFFVELWNLALSQHESVASVLLDLISDAFEDYPMDSIHAIEFLNYLSSIPSNQTRFLLDLLSYFRKKTSFSALTCTIARTEIALNLMWQTISKLDDDSIETGYSLFVGLLYCEFGKQKRQLYASKCLAEISNCCDTNQDSFRCLTLFRKILDVETEEEKVALLSELKVEPDLLQLLIKDLSLKEHEGGLRLKFRLETMVSVSKYATNLKKSYTSFDQIQKVTSLIRGDKKEEDDREELRCFFLGQVLKTGKMSLEDVCETFNRLICPAWHKLCQSGAQSTESFERRTLAVWKCFAEYFEDMKRIWNEDDINVENSIRIGKECLWEAALTPFAAVSVTELACKLAIQETNQVSDVLPKILNSLRNAQTKLKKNIEEDSSRGIISRCLSVLSRFAESEKYVHWQTEPLPHGAPAGGSMHKLVISVVNSLLEPLPQQQTHQITLDIFSNTAVRDIIELAKRELDCDSLSLYLNNVDISDKWWTSLDSLTQGNLNGPTFRIIPKRLISPQIPLEEYLESARMILARSDPLFELLHELQIMGDRLGDAKTELVGLLSILPSRRSLVTHLTIENDASYWSCLLSGPNHCGNVYRLEAVNSFLSASSPFQQELSKTVRARFVSMGGLKAAVDFFDRLLSGPIEPCEIVFQGNGLRTVLKTVNMCSKEIGQRKEELKICMSRLLEIFEAEEDMNAPSHSSISQMIKSWNSETVFSLRYSSIHAAFQLIHVLDLASFPLIISIIEKMVTIFVRILRTNENQNLRTLTQRVLEHLARSPSISQLVWKSVITGISWSDKPESFRNIYCVWQAKRPHAEDEEDGARIVNSAWEFAELLESIGSIHQVHDSSLTYCLELIVHMLWNVQPSSERTYRAVPVRTVKNPETRITWLFDRVIFSREASKNKLMLTSACYIAMLLCMAEDSASIPVAIACRRLFHENLKSKIDHTPKILEWSFDPDQMLRSVETGFVGLVNQGATCYMNSLLQQFFLSPILRSWISRANPEDIDVKEESDKFPEKESQAREVLRQVRRVFRFLDGSARRSINPKDLVESCKTLNLSNPVHSQNDARDLCDKLVDRIEIALKAAGYENPTRECFGGRVIHQNIKKGCPHPPTERADDFIALELQIQGKKDLESSLRDFCAGEVLDGENRVHCDECNIKYPAILRDCLSDNLPRVLVLHLKRFQLDYDTFETVKVNDRLSFPMTLDVGPFTRKGLELQEKGLEEQIVPKMYNLCGVLVHRGVAGGGHYYSFAKDHNTSKWYRFNDERVSPFDVKKLGEECFGGKPEVNGAVDPDTSAYMLFYEESDPNFELFNPENPIMESKPCIEIEFDNETLASQLILCSAELANAFISILEHPIADREGENVEENLALLSFDLCLDWCLRTNNAEMVERWSTTILSLQHNHRSWMPQEVLSRISSHLKEAVSKCRNPMIRKAFLKMGSTSGALNEGTPSLANFLNSVLNLLPDLSKSLRHTNDILQALLDLLHDSSHARGLMRGITFQDGVVKVNNGLARLVHFTLGNLDSPFTQKGQILSSDVRDEEISVILEAEKFVDEIPTDGEFPVFPPFDWSWGERLARWNSANLAPNSSVLNLPNYTGITNANQLVFEHLYSCLGACICPINSLPSHIQSLFNSANGPFYMRAIREGCCPGALSEWILELCRLDVSQGVEDRKQSNSYRIVMDLLAQITRPPNPVYDLDADAARYESCVSALSAVLGLQDEWQYYRIGLCFNNEGAGTISPAICDNLLTACSGPMKRYWGPVYHISSSFSIALEEKVPVPNLWRLSFTDTTHCDRHVKTLARLIQDIPNTAEALKRASDLQKREVAVGDDDLSRLVYWFAGRSFDIFLGGETTVDHRTGLKKRSSESDLILRTLAPIASISPITVVSGKLWRSDALVYDDFNRYELGPHHLFDEKGQFAVAFAYLVDQPVKNGGVVVEFQCRMGAKYTKDNGSSDNEDSNERYYCIVVGRRPGDSIVRMKDTANGDELRVFDRVMVKAVEVHRKRMEMQDRSNSATPPSSPPPLESSDENNTTMETPNKKPKLDVITTPKTVTRTSPRNNVGVECMYGVVIRITTVGKRKNVVVRLDSMIGEVSSVHSQLIEIDGDIDDDQFVLEFQEDQVIQSNEPLCVTDHQFTIVRTSLIPAFNANDCRVVHSRKLEVPVLCGERVGIARHAQLGFAWSQWHEFDPKIFSYYYSAQSIVAKEGSVLGHTLNHESNARPGFQFKIQ